MSAVDEADRLAMELVRAFPHWPATMGPCMRCNDNPARGSDLCADCLTTDLAEIVGESMAKRMFALAKTMGWLRADILKAARESGK